MADSAPRAPSSPPGLPDGRLDDAESLLIDRDAVIGEVVLSTALRGRPAALYRRAR